MLRATTVLPAGTWPADAATGSVTLTWEDRHRRRIRMADDAGQSFLLDLDRPTAMADGDGLALEGAGVLRIMAAAEPVLEVACQSAAEAARVAWHLGNRHTPIQVLADGGLRLRDDHVLAGMLRHLGVESIRCHAPFEPEPGAYFAGPTPGDGHNHGH